MKYRFAFLVSFFFFIACESNQKLSNELPPSILERDGIYEFHLKNSDYSTVSFGSTASMNWSILPMQKRDTTWVVELYGVSGHIEYKFLINDSLWITDPLNKNKVPVPHPYEGFNSVVQLK